MTVDLAAGWEVAGLTPGLLADPKGLPEAVTEWVPASVPGTVAGAWRARGRELTAAELDGTDWWYRCRFDAAGGRRRLALDGIATVADVWLNGQHLAHSDNMFRAVHQPVEVREGPNELVVRCAALAPLLARPRPGPRPRWKSYLVAQQNLRWVRTSLLGRLPGWAEVPPPVGLWRPVRLLPADGSVPTAVSLRATCVGAGGAVEARLVLADAARSGDALGTNLLRIAPATGATAPRHRPLPDGRLTARREGDDLVLEGRLDLPQVERWWPHTHGPQPLYEVRADIAGRSRRLGRVGFRTVAADRTGDGFRLEVNGEPVFCRGACWLPPAPVDLTTPDEVLAERLALVRAANLNMLRVPGTTAYEDRRFFERCDELGLLVWQDCPFAFTDPPPDAAFAEGVTAEVTEALGSLAAHPSLAVVCGNQEVEEVAAMNGLGPADSATPLFDELVAGIARRVVPGAVYVPSNPTGGGRPFRMDQGISQYFGVGGYLRPIEDARRAGVRFAAECLALATPPEPETVEECGGAERAGHDPGWKRAVHHDAGRSWDMEDVRDHYVAQLFGVDPLRERYVDPYRALELGRAANAHLVESVMAEWRRPGSSCDGALVLALGDLRAGAGWGMVDVHGRPKAPWFALRRVCQPVALLAIDEGLNGLALHVLNDTDRPLLGRLTVELVARGEVVVEAAETSVAVPAHRSGSYDAETLLGGFRDVTYAYRFSPPAHDAVVATLWSGNDRGSGNDSRMRSQVVHLPLGQGRPVEADLGLTAVARVDGDGAWSLEVATARLAQWVSVRVPGFACEDSWFHLPPGSRRHLAVWPVPSQADGPPATGTAPVALPPAPSSLPRGTVGALNCLRRSAVEVVAG